MEHSVRGPFLRRADRRRCCVPPSLSLHGWWSVLTTFASPSGGGPDRCVWKHSQGQVPRTARRHQDGVPRGQRRGRRDELPLLTARDQHTQVSFPPRSLTIPASADGTESQGRTAPEHRAVYRYLARPHQRPHTHCDGGAMLIHKFAEYAGVLTILLHDVISSISTSKMETCARD